MAGRPASEIDEVAKRVQIHLLLQQYRRDGSVSADAVVRCGQRLGVAARTVWRWLRDEKKPKEQRARRRPRFEQTEETLTQIRMRRAVRLAWQDLRADGRITCGENAFYAAFGRLEPAIRAGVLGGLDALKSKQHFFDFGSRAEHRNARWEIDNCLLPMVIWSEVDQKLLRPWLTLIIDVYSRVVLSFSVTTGQDVAATTESVMCAIAEAVLGRTYDGVFVGGLPESIGIDLGGDYTSHPLYIGLTRLGIEVDPAPRETPEHKAMVERVLEYIERTVLPMLAGFDERLAQKKAA